MEKTLIRDRSGGKIDPLNAAGHWMYAAFAWIPGAVMLQAANVHPDEPWAPPVGLLGFLLLASAATCLYVVVVAFVYRVLKRSDDSLE